MGSIISDHERKQEKEKNKETGKKAVVATVDDLLPLTSESKEIKSIDIPVYLLYNSFQMSLLTVLKIPLALKLVNSMWKHRFRVLTMC